MGDRKRERARASERERELLCLLKATYYSVKRDLLTERARERAALPPQIVTPLPTIPPPPPLLLIVYTRVAGEVGHV